MRRKKWTKRVAALGISAVMLCVTPVSAQEIQTPDQTQDQESTVIKNTDASGTCGSDITWALDKTTGTLLISGSGKMDNFEEDDDFRYRMGAPWLKFCHDIKKVVISPGVTSIGDYAFGDCDVEQVEIPDSVTKIGEQAFDYCQKLKTVEIPESVVEIKTEAFHACKQLENITIGGNLRKIGAEVFANCSKLKQIELPKSVTKIELCAFTESSLENIFVDENNPKYKSMDGNLYNKSGSVLIWGSTKKQVEIPAGVKKIEAYAFYNNEIVERVIIPDGVTEIGEWAFFIAGRTVKIKVPQSVTEIGKQAFREKESVIFGEKDSYAYNYALEDNIAFCQGTFEEYQVVDAIIDCPQTIVVTADKKKLDQAYVYYGRRDALKAESSNPSVVTNKRKIVGPGIAVVKLFVKSNGMYGGCTKKVTVKVGPVKQEASVKGKEKNLAVSWKKDKKATGYELQYSTDAKFKNDVKKVNAAKNTITSKTITNCKAGKKYYTRVRSYITVKVNGKKEKVYGNWSKTVSAEIKK